MTTNEQIRLSPDQLRAALGSEKPDVQNASRDGDGVPISRRGLLIAGAATAGALVLPQFLTPSVANAADFAFVAYHGVNGAAHQQKFNELAPQGYRMISLSVYGAPPLYAAVWVKRNGPAWVGAHGLTASQYQAKYNEMTAQGFIPVMLAATGARSSPTFAAVFERITAPVWLARHGLTDGPEGTSGTLANANKWARDNKCILKTLAIYGTGASDRTYAGVWLPNPGAIKWQAHDMGDGAGYQKWFNGYTQVPMRPSIVDANGGHQFAALFTDDTVGTWVSRHGMTGADYQAEFNRQTAAGLMPVIVQGSGTGSGIRYTAVFAATDQPIARQWSQTGTAATSYPGVHTVMKNFMQKHGVRAGVLAVRKNGDLKLSSGYTWGEPSYAITQPTSLFRLASVSKAFACAAIQQLVNTQGFNMNTRVFQYLGITTVALPSQVRDARIDNITVQHLVDHTGGWLRSVSNFDPVFQGRAITQKLGLPGHVSKTNVARYMYGEPLQYNPGDSTAFSGDQRYSNFGYLLLGLIVERATGQSFINYVKQQILAPLGVDTAVFAGGTPRSQRLADEVSYDASWVGASAWQPATVAFVPAAYGNFLIAEMDSGGGLVASAPAVSAFINRHAVWGMGGRMPGAARSGGMAGSASLAVSRGDGIDWTYIFNTVEVPEDKDANGKTNLDRLYADLESAIGAAGF